MELSGLSLAITNVLGGRLNPLSWFAAGEQGAWYDPSDLTTLFQDSAGTTPVTLSPMEQPVGLMLDKSKGLVLGAELVTNGGPFTNTTGWAATSTTLNIVSTELKVTNNIATVGQANYSISTVVGKMYVAKGVMRADAANAVVASCRLNIDTSVATWVYVTTNGVDKNINIYFTATATTTTFSFQIASGGAAGALGDSLYVSNISVKQITGNHAFQATAPNRPLLSARVNLLTYTEVFSNPDWNKGTGVAVTTNTTIAPDGTLTATTYAVTSTGTYREISQGGTDSTVATYTFTIYAKPFTTNCITLAISDHTTTAKGYVFTLTGIGSYAVFAGDVGSAMGRVSASIEQSTNGFYKCTVVVNNITATSLYKSIYISDSAGSNTGTTGASVYIWHPDFRPTNSGALLPPYQRVTTATDYDTAGFPLYLKCNGTSSAMSTNAINFTGTDKMTVVTGVRKLVDQNNAILMELSLNTGPVYLGSFNIHSPLSTSANYTTYCIGSGAVASNVTSQLNYLAPISNVLTVLDDIGATTPNEIKLKVNSIFTGTQSGDADTGNFGNYPLYLFARAGTSLFLNGQFYGAIIRGAQSDTASVTQTENYMAQKTGITF